jgi:hypothetical protein
MRKLLVLTVGLDILVLIVGDKPSISQSFHALLVAFEVPVVQSVQHIFWLNIVQHSLVIVIIIVPTSTITGKICLNDVCVAAHADKHRGHARGHAQHVAYTCTVLGVMIMMCSSLPKTAAQYS